MEKISLTKFPVNRENPFLKQAIEQVQSHVVKRFQNSTGSTKQAILQAINPETKEPVGYTSFVRKIEIDDDQFTKVYAANLQAFFDLSKTGMRVLAYVFTCMRVSKDTILFDMEDAMNYCGYKSHRSVYAGLTELLKADIIARGKNENLYFINPMIIFNGNRINFIKQYVKKSASNEIEEEQNLTPKQLEFFAHPANEDAAKKERLQGSQTCLHSTTPKKPKTER